MAKSEELTHWRLLEYQEGGTDALEWDGNGMDVEIWLLTDGGGLVVAPELFHHKGSFLNSNKWSECVPEVLIAMVM